MRHDRIFHDVYKGRERPQMLIRTDIPSSRTHEVPGKLWGGTGGDKKYVSVSSGKFLNPILRLGSSYAGSSRDPSRRAEKQVVRAGNGLAGGRGHKRGSIDERPSR
ncbi:hypothetical protein GJ744_004307 [Endocarpon pusillum]|uniref:Uncharacterized protein n=1 Tax=Endocarpon pusillum TaxID=364733 RepID=A0A8H7E031_9EURO|nr:hypothetical protein GJ744_004307 [Endocarpon pusillum]